jgi:formylglycine-generating enzyme required for sulfatase activity
MRLSPLVLLLAAVIGCGSDATPDKPSIDAVHPSNAAKSEPQANPDALPPVTQSGDAELKANPTKAVVPVANSIGMRFVPIPAGTFTMGSPEDESGRVDTDETLHKVTLTQPFELGVYEVTQEHYQRVMGLNRSAFKGSQNPVEGVHWNDAVEFCQKLSDLSAEKNAGYVYRLPTEAEWEYACRAGTTTGYSFGDSGSKLGDYAWYNRNVEGTTHPVGGKKPNAWGLYDMHGNVCKWCQDWYGDYPSGSVTDPTGAARGSDRVIRGGSWHRLPGSCRSADRGRNAPVHRYDGLGFRVLRSSIK